MPPSKPPTGSTYDATGTSCGKAASFRAQPLP